MCWAVFKPFHAEECPKQNFGCIYRKVKRGGYRSKQLAVSTNDCENVVHEDVEKEQGPVAYGTLQSFVSLSVIGLIPAIGGALVLKDAFQGPSNTSRDIATITVMALTSGALAAGFFRVGYLQANQARIKHNRAYITNNINGSRPTGCTQRTHMGCDIVCRANRAIPRYDSFGSWLWFGAKSFWRTPF